MAAGIAHPAAALAVATRVGAGAGVEVEAKLRVGRAVDLAGDGDAHRARHDHDVAGQRAFLEHHALEPPLVVFEQLGGPEVLGDEDRIAAQAGAGRGAELARNDPQ